jgi:hypothetical protein
MNAALASLINAIILISLGLYGYVSSTTPSITAIIPIFVGVLLFLINSGVKKENKMIAHLAVLLTLLILLGLIKPLLGATGRNDSMATFRIIAMMVSCVFAMVYFIKSFIEAKKRRQL